MVFLSFFLSGPSTRPVVVLLSTLAVALKFTLLEEAWTLVIVVYVIRRERTRVTDDSLHLD